MTDYRSKVPFHALPDALPEQEAVLDWEMGKIY